MGDEEYDQMTNAYLDGERVGVENKMYEDLLEWLKDPTDNGGVTILYESLHNSAAFLAVAVAVATVAEWLEPTSDELESMQQAGTMVTEGVIEVNDLEQPYNGWQEYDAWAALEHFHDTVEIPEIAEHKVPEKGAGGNLKEFIKIA